MVSDAGKWVGRMAAMIYMDSQGNMTQRRIRILAVRSRYIQAYCLERRAPRLFRRENVLSLLPLPERKRPYDPYSA